MDTPRGRHPSRSRSGGTYPGGGSTWILYLPRPVVGREREAARAAHTASQVVGERPDGFEPGLTVTRLVWVLGGLVGRNGTREEATALEAKFGKYVALRPSLEAIPKTAPSTEDRRRKRYRRLLAREKAWTTKLRRAATALKDIRARRRRYERLGIRP